MCTHASVSDVTLADLEWHKRELLRKVHVEAIITGNVLEQVSQSQSTS